MSDLNTNTKPVGAPKAPFSSFSLDYSRLLTDDFVHGKLLTLKYAGKGQRFVVNGKEVLNLVKKEGKEVPSTSNEVKYVQNIRGRNLEAKFDSKGLVRFWASLGEYNLGEKLSFYAKIKTNREFNKVSGNVHAEYKGKKCHAEARIDLKKDFEPFFNNKVVLTEGNAKFGYVAKLSLTKFSLARYNVFASYSQKQFEGYLEHISNNRTKIALGEIVAAAIYKHAGHQFVVKASYDKSKDVPAEGDKDKPQPLNVQLGALFKVNNETQARAKIDNKGDLALSAKHKFNNNFSLVAGTNINLLNPKSFLTGNTIPIPLGLQAEFTFN